MLEGTAMGTLKIFKEFICYLVERTDFNCKQDKQKQQLKRERESERERERGRQRETETDRERERYRQTDRQNKERNRGGVVVQSFFAKLCKNAF